MGWQVPWTVHCPDIACDGGHNAMSGRTTYSSDGQPCLDWLYLLSAGVGVLLVCVCLRFCFASYHTTLLRFIPYHSQSNRKDNPCGKRVKFNPTTWTVRGSRDYSWTTPRLLPNGTRVLPELPFRKPGLLPPKFGTPLSENRISAEIVDFSGLGPVIGPADAIFGPAQSWEFPADFGAWFA